MQQRLLGKCGFTLKKVWLKSDRWDKSSVIDVKWGIIHCSFISRPPAVGCVMRPPSTWAWWPTSCWSLFCACWSSSWSCTSCPASRSRTPKISPPTGAWWRTCAASSASSCCSASPGASLCSPGGRSAYRSSTCSPSSTPCWVSLFLQLLSVCLCLFNGWISLLQVSFFLFSTVPWRRMSAGSGEYTSAVENCGCRRTKVGFLRSVFSLRLHVWKADDQSTWFLRFVLCSCSTFGCSAEYKHVHYK